MQAIRGRQLQEFVRAYHNIANAEFQKDLVALLEKNTDHEAFLKEIVGAVGDGIG